MATAPKRTRKRPVKRRPARSRAVSAVELRKRLRDTERRLREVEHRHEVTMAAVNESVYDWDIVRGRFTPALSMSRVLGLSQERLGLEAWQRAIHPDDYPRFREATVAHLKGLTERFECDYRYRDATGAWRWARTHGMAIRDRKGRAVRMIGSTGDITELKRAEIELHSAHEETRAALEQQTATAEILKVIASSPSDVQPVFDAIVQSAARLFGCNAALHSMDGEWVDLRAVAGSEVRSDRLDELRKLYPVPVDGVGNMISRAIKTAAILEATDLQAAEAPESWKTFSRVGNFRSATQVPLMREGRGIGALGLFRVRPGFRLNDKQRALAQTFADQAVIAIENVRLFRELEARNTELSEALEQQTATAEVLRAISQSPADLRPILETLVRAASRFCGAPDVVLTRLDGEVLRGGAAVGSFVDVLVEQSGSIEAVAIPVNRGSVTGRAVVDRSIVHVTDLAAEPESEFPVGRELQRRYGHHTMVSVPLMREGVPLGALALIRREVRPFSEKQLALLKTFADQAVIAIENVRLFNETKEALERQTATAEVLRVISSSPTDVTPVFDAIAERARVLCGASLGYTTRLDGDRLHLVGYHGTSPQAEAAMRASFPRKADRGSINGRCILARMPVQIVDVQLDPEYQLNNEAKAAEYRSMLAVPMLHGDTPIGVVGVARREFGKYSEKLVGLLQTFANQAVIAIENVRLFNETKESLERQIASGEILASISGSMTDTKPVFDAIVRNLLRLFDTRFAAVGLLRDGKIEAAGIEGERGYEKLAARFPIPVDERTLIGRVVLAGDVMQFAPMIGNPAVPPASEQLAREFGFDSQIAAPMIREGKVIGAIATARRDAVPFNDKQVALLRSFADQAVIAIENVRLFNETKEALERQTATAAVLRVISASPNDVGPVFAEILDHATQLCEAQLGFVFTTDGSAFEPVAQRGLDAEPYAAWRAAFRVNRVATPMSGLGRVLATRAPVHIADVADDEAYRTRDPLRVLTVEGLGARTFLAVPLLKDGAVIGAVVIYRREVRPFSDKQMFLLQTFADQAVIAIENVRLFKELQGRTEALSKSVQQLTALSEVGQAISSTLDLDKVLQTIVAHAVKLTGLDGGTIYEFDAPDGTFHLRAAVNMPEELAEVYRRQPIQLGEGIVGRAAAERQPVQVPDIEDASYQTRYKEQLLRKGYRAILAVPLLREGQAIGALTVNRRQPGEFAPEIVELLNTFATQSAMAIQNARLFREIAEKSHQLEEASRHKSQFLASMSHELRTPLNAVLGLNEMMLGGIYGDVPEDMQAPLAQTQASGKHLLNLINNVLDLAKIEANRMELARSDYVVQDLIASVRATLSPLAAEKGLEFAAACPEDIPIAHGDAGRLTQCLINLAGNALKFTKQGRVGIGVALDGERLRFSVADTGIGIPPEKMQDLFTEFKQTDATIASEYGGTGLGLAITKKFVEMHGGRIWVESEPDRGSTFLFEVPLRAEATGATP